jgi:two-component system, sensor histidine kinase ChiS
MNEMNLVQKQIVIVEDEPDTAEMLADMMALNGYGVKKSFGGTQALQLIMREKPDAVLLDVMMPDLSGLEVLRFMRRDPRLEHIPVIVVSARTLPSEIQGGMEAGATSYLTKPVGYHELKKAVDDALHTAGAPAL